MSNKFNNADIYLMGIGGTAMGAFAGLLKSQGSKIRGSDQGVYSPMREKLQDWGIEYKTPYSVENLHEKPDLVVIGNVIRQDNPEVQEILKQEIPFDSFPSMLYKNFLKNKKRIVITGTHGKTTCSSLTAHLLYSAGYNPGFLIGGIPKNFGESFRYSNQDQEYFVIEGDEYDTAFFDKRAKFFHYHPDLLLVTSLEFDHGDIYRDLEHIISTFAEFFASLKSNTKVIYNFRDINIIKALEISNTQAKLVSYNNNSSYHTRNNNFTSDGIISNMFLNNYCLGKVNISMFGEHNLSNFLGCYALLRELGLEHQEISQGLKKFMGVSRRMDEKLVSQNFIIIDDFAHHPSAVQETIKACKQKYSQKKIVAIFEPRSATSCTNLFEHEYSKSFLLADEVILAPLGRKANSNNFLDTQNIASSLRKSGVKAYACANMPEFKNRVFDITGPAVLLFMSNGDFGGLQIKYFIKLFSDKSS